MENYFGKLFTTICEKINFDDFIDHLIAKEILSVEQYLHHFEDISITYLWYSISSNEKAIQTVYNYFNASVDRHSIEFERCLLFGGFPTFPPNYLKREDKVTKIRTHLVELRPEKKLLIWGPFGYGKSSLLLEALCDKLICTFFNFEIFWVDMAEVKPNNVFFLMQNLYEKVVDKIQANGQIIYQKKDNLIDIDNLKQELRKAFVCLKNPLLILDNVKDNDLEEFNIKEVKTVVTSQNNYIIKCENYSKYELRTGFSEKECQELFYAYLNNYQSSINEIYSICKGHPMVLAHIVGYLNNNAEEALDNQSLEKSNNVWSEVMRKLRHGKYQLNNYEKQIEGIIEMCVNKLPEELQNLFLKLVIFKEDINLKRKVLTLLFRKDFDEVRDVMNELTARSLIVRYYDKNEYIYGLHPIVAMFLQNKCSAKQKMEFHRRLLDGYGVLNDRIEEFEGDDYMLEYFAYHLLEAQMLDKFGVYYLNPTFLEWKIKSTGPSDTLRELDLYRENITNNDLVLETQFNEAVKFINKYGLDMYNFHCMDFVQCALQEPKKSEYFQRAESIMRQSQRLYFGVQSVEIVNSLQSEQLVIRNATVAVFLDVDYILYGKTKGKIMLFNKERRKNIESFVGHTGRIKQLVVSPDKNFFLSCSDDKTVKLWSLEKKYNRDSPKYKQKNWLELHLLNNHKSSLQTFALDKTKTDFLTSAGFPSNYARSRIIATGTNNGDVILWRVRDAVQLASTSTHGNLITNILFTHQNVLIFAQNDNLLFYDYKTGKTQLNYKQTQHVPGNLLLNSLVFNDATNQLFGVSSQHLIVYKNEQIFAIFNSSNPEDLNLSLTISPDGKYLFVGTTRGVQIWNVWGKIEMINSFLNGPTVFLDPNQSNELLMTNTNGTVNQIQFNRNLRHTSAINATWIRSPAFIAVVHEQPRNNQTIQIYQNCNILVESNLQEVTISYICFSLCGNYLIYALKSGKIFKFNVKDKQTEFLLEIDGFIKFLKFFSCGETSNKNDLLVIVDSKDVITVYNDFTKKIRKQTISSGKVLNCFNGCFVVVDKFGRIFFWNLQDNNNKIDLIFKFTGDTSSNRVTSAVLLWKYSLLAISMALDETTFSLDIMRIVGGAETIKIESLDRLSSSGEVKVLSFSFDGCLLAAGLTSGAIEIRHVRRKFSLELQLTEQNVPVNSLIFSPYKHYLVSTIGDKFAFWDLCSLAYSDTSDEQNHNLRSYEQIDNTKALAKLLADKEPVCSKDYLLAAIKLRGSGTLMLANYNFTSFLVVHDNGNFSILDILS